MLARLLTFLMILALPLHAQEVEADDPLAEFLWTARPVIVFADTPEDPRFLRQMEEFATAERDLEERSLVLIVDTEGNEALRERFRPRGFLMVLVDTDGTVEYRTRLPITMRELVRRVDNMTSREIELRAERAARRDALEALRRAE
ncbi:DUF4174 domain-containing protein [Roseobacter sp. HKCCA0434]|uniref:DUF4174 domain-containing protein n=1 Tax=Roseobacter sp. HKCCA0434 TaxID=3079297 RepID=UPI002905A5D8|nr:DUF4174 domain-containing protein [Roseobacter sp. HKCCA0434]